jgi:hypothetical protein
VSVRVLFVMEAGEVIMATEPCSRALLGCSLLSKVEVG